MKRTLKMIVMLLCVATFATFSSCSKDNDSLNNQNGGGNSGGGGNSSNSYPFTLGYYHPERKVKKITYTHMLDGKPYEVDTCYFTWTGNDLDKITYKKLLYSYFGYDRDEVEVDEENGYYVFTYNDLGYIHTIDEYEYSDYSNRYEHISSDTVRYKEFGDEFTGGTHYYVWIGDDTYDPYYGYGYGSYEGHLYAFNANGLLEALDRKSVTLDANGNIISRDNYFEYSYDNKKNPFKNLILSSFDGLYALTYTWSCGLFVCPNNCVVEDNEVPLVYEYRGDYPTTIKRSLDDQYIIWEIEYFN